MQIAQVYRNLSHSKIHFAIHLQQNIIHSGSGQYDRLVTALLPTSEKNTKMIYVFQVIYLGFIKNLHCRTCPKVQSNLPESDPITSVNASNTFERITN